MLVSHSAGEYSSACWETPRGLHSIFLIHSRSSRYPRIHSESSERTRLHQRRRPRVSVTEDLNVTELQLQHEHTQHSIYSSLPVTEKTHTALYTSIHMLRTSAFECRTEKNISRSIHPFSSTYPGPVIPHISTGRQRDGFKTILKYI